MPISTLKIFPPIGVARLGNSPTDFYIGPESPGVTVQPEGGYKDDQCRIKRQAAKFRIYAYDENDHFIGEITENEADITWTVHLGSKKAAFHGNDPSRKVDPGSRTLTGPLQSAKFNNGSFSIPNFPSEKVDLGEIRTDRLGRLIVLGGFGRSFSPDPAAGITNYLSNPDWTDDTSDGPVNATVTLHSTGSTFQALGSWVIVGPPKFAPDIPNVITLYDRLYNYQRDHVSEGSNKFPIPDLPSFKNDIYPILKAAILSNWVTGYIQGGHENFDTNSSGFANLASNSTSNPPLAARTAVYNALSGSGGSPGNMPDLYSASGSNLDEGGRTKLTPVQLAMMEKWKDGSFIADWGSFSRSSPTDSITPDGLTFAALSNCVGAAFFPGIEAGKVLVPQAFGLGPSQNYPHDIFLANEAFRLDQSKLGPGEVTKDMAVPWQADYAACTGCWWGTGADWWPAQRPRKAQVWNDATQQYEFQIWDRGANGYLDMVQNWNNLGFVLKEEINGQVEYIEAERCDTGSILLLTPSIEFKDIPIGHGNTIRTTHRAIMFDVVSPSRQLTFTISSFPTDPSLSVVGSSFVVPATAPNTSSELLVPIQFRAGPGTNSPISNSVSIRCSETSQIWTVSIHASTIAPKTAGAVLVMDISGSMNQYDSDGITKIAKLRAAAETFVNHMQDGDGIGLVVYNQNATVIQNMTTINATTRASTIATIKGPQLNAGGMTSIGDGIDMGRTMLNGTSVYDFEAMVVITDGKENNPKYIRDVAAQINTDTYAVGIGQAQNISASALQAIANNNGGYFLVTGASNDQFRLQKYFLQILSSISNRNILLDPSGTLHPGTTHKIPFHLSDADVWVDVTLLSSDIEHTRFYLEAPSGHRIMAEQVDKIDKVEYRQEDNHAFFRLHAAVSIERGRHVWEGNWHVVLASDSKRSSDYSVVVHAHTDLEFEAYIRTIGKEDHSIRISATLNQNSRILERPARIWGELTGPKGGQLKVRLERNDHGQFITTFDPHQIGHYDLRLRAAGQTNEGVSFYREKHLTFNVLHPVDEDPTQTPATQDNPVVIHPTQGYMVLGKVRRQSGESVEGLVIKAFDKDTRGKNDLGKAKLTADGHYRIPYSAQDYKKTKKELGGADIMLWVYDKKKIIHKTDPHYDSPKVTIIDIDLP